MSMLKQDSRIGAGGSLNITPDQEAILDHHFSRNKNLYPSDVAILAAETGLEEHQVEQWFYQRLASWRRDQGLSPLVGRLCE